MLKVGITGGIGSGKSTVARMFEILGIPVYHADTAAKRLMETDADLMYRIRTHFGASAYENGRLNRAYIAQRVFNHKAELEWLNQQVHPATRADAAAWFAQQKAPYALKEAALLFESGTAGELDIIIGVFAPETVRIHRVMQRDGITAEQIRERMRNQIEETVKMKLCHYQIINNEQQLVIPQVLQLHQILLQKAVATTPTQ